MDALEHINHSLDDIAAADTLEALDALRVALLGKSGIVTAALKALGALPAEERKARGAEVNRAKEHLVQALAARKAALEKIALDRRLAAERIDVTLPGRRADRGSLHPITRTLERITEIFARLGYELADGPEIEDDWHNFEALNFPPHHPARAMHDTFYFPDGRLLRTHTSPVQIRAALGRTPPIRLIAAGKVYRSDSDQTHTPMFHQVEGLLVDEASASPTSRARWSNSCARSSSATSRCASARATSRSPNPRRKSISAGTARTARTSWLEVLGCGMVHPNVLRNCGIDPERYTGFAFGLGVERFAMLRYGVNDLRQFFENDLRFLRQFA